MTLGVNIVVEKNIFFPCIPVKKNLKLLLCSTFSLSLHQKEHPEKEKGRKVSLKCRATIHKKKISCAHVNRVKIYTKTNNKVGSCVGCTDKDAGTGFKMFHPEYPVSPKRTCSRRKCKVKNSARLDR